MNAKQARTAANRRSVRMAPAVPRQRGGGTATPAAELFASRQALECVDGSYAWR